jgi:hypothetical protein
VTITAPETAPLQLVSRSFGFSPSESQHHFCVLIPRGANLEVRLSEHLTWNERSGSSPVTLGTGADGQARVLLARPKWDAIADVVRAEFNRRLRQQGQHAGAWRSEENLLRRDLGKELVLLAWAIEDADPALIAAAVANWQGLYPEERWWLYTQTAAASGHASTGRGIGWRKALRYALTENPVSDAQHEALPEYYRLAQASGQTALFDPSTRYGADPDAPAPDAEPS